MYVFLREDKAIIKNNGEGIFTQSLSLQSYSSAYFLISVSLLHNGSVLLLLNNGRHRIQQDGSAYLNLLVLSRYLTVPAPIIMI